MAKQETSDAVKALVHNIVLNEQGWFDKVVLAWVETAFYDVKGNEFSSLQSVGNYLSAKFGMQFDQLDVQQAIDSLCGVSIVSSSKGWLLAPDRKVQISTQIQESRRLEEEVKQEWLLIMQTQHPTLGKVTLKDLWNIMISSFVGPLFLKLGAESLYLVTHSGKPLHKGSYVAILGQSVKNIEDPVVRNIALKEFAEFTTPTSQSKRQYLMRLLDYSLAQHALGLNKTLLQTIRKTPPRFVLLADTNLLYSVVGLDDNPYSAAAKLFVEAANRLKEQLDLQLCFADVTQSEYIRTIDASRFSLAGSRWAPDLSRAALRCMPLRGLAKAYHTSNAGSPIEPEMFFDRFRNPIPILRGLGIQLYDEKFLELKTRQDVIDDIHDFNEMLKEQQSPRQWATVEHDVVLWHIARNKRPASDSFGEAVYFVITHDYRFTKFDSHKQKQLGYKTPICVFPNHFYQAIRFFLPRSDDIETAFLNSLKVPLLMPPSQENQEVASKILRALALYSDLPEEVACDILADQALSNEIRKVVDKQDLVADIIDKALGIRLREKQVEEEKLRAEKDLVVRDRENLSSTVERLDATLRQYKEETELRMKVRDAEVADLKHKEQERDAYDRQELAHKREKAAIRRALTQYLAVLAGFFAAAGLAAYFLSDVLAFVPVRNGFWYYVCFSVAAIAWFGLARRSKLRETDFWIRWVGRGKKAGGTVIILGGVGQGIVLLIQLSSR